MPHVLLAYIDPGSGSLIVQVMVATIVAVPLFFRSQIGKLVRRIRGRNDQAGPTDDESDQA